MIRRAVVLVALLVATFLGMESTIGRATPIALPLRELPLTIDGWTGSEESVSEVMRSRARPTTAIARRYLNREAQGVELYVGYYARQASQGQVLLACEGECDVVRSRVASVETAQGQIEVVLATVSQDGAPVIVAYWLQEGRHAAPPSSGFRLQQARLTLLRGRSEGMAVRVAAPVVGPPEAAEGRVLAFVAAVYPHLTRHLPVRPE